MRDFVENQRLELCNQFELLTGPTATNSGNSVSDVVDINWVASPEIEAGVWETKLMTKFDDMISHFDTPRDEYDRRTGRRTKLQ